MTIDEGPIAMQAPAGCNGLAMAARLLQKLALYRPRGLRLDIVRRVGLIQVKRRTAVDRRAIDCLPVRQRLSNVMIIIISCKRGYIRGAIAHIGVNV